MKTDNLNEKIVFSNEKPKPIKILCVLSFVVVALTSVPLLITYFKGVSMKHSLITDLHVWAGIIFIIFSVLRIARVKFGKRQKINYEKS